MILNRSTAVPVGLDLPQESRIAILPIGLEARLHVESSIL